MYRINVVNSPTSQPLNVAAASQHHQQPQQLPQHLHLQQSQTDSSHHVPLQLVSNTATLQSPLILSHLGSNNNNILSTNHNINNGGGGGGETSSGSGVANLIDVSSVASNNVNRLASNDEIMITAVKVEPVHETIAGTSSNAANNGGHYGNKRPRMEG
jgi:hypothetical protein